MILSRFLPIKRYLELFEGKVQSLFYLVSACDGKFSKFKLSIILILSSFLFRAFFEKISYSPEIRFKNFRIKFRTATGELTPYKEIQEVVLLDIFPQSDISNWTVIDCGANIGLFSLFLGKAKKIIAVEPNTDCCLRLSHNFKVNQINGSIINCAVTSQEGEIKMSIGKSSVLAQIEETGNITVKATTIDRIISDNSLLSVDLLKLDLEGHEIEALLGAKTALSHRIIKRIYAEFNSQQALDKLDDYLQSLNYHRKFTSGYNALYELEL